MSVNIGGSKLPIEELHFSFITNKLRTEYGFIESSKEWIFCIIILLSRSFSCNNELFFASKAFKYSNNLYNALHWSLCDCNL